MTLQQDSSTMILFVASASFVSNDQVISWYTLLLHLVKANLFPYERASLWKLKYFWMSRFSLLACRLPFSNQPSPCCCVKMSFLGICLTFLHHRSSWLSPATPAESVLCCHCWRVSIYLTCWPVLAWVAGKSQGFGLDGAGRGGAREDNFFFSFLNKPWLLLELESLEQCILSVCYLYLPKMKIKPCGKKMSWILFSFCFHFNMRHAKWLDLN